MGGLRLPQVFDEEYNSYSFVFQDKAHLEGSDKIFLPPSALDTLARLHIDYPMLFQITCRASGKRTHCGVLEFSAAEGSCYLPYWMMQNLLLEEGGFLQVGKDEGRGKGGDEGGREGGREGGLHPGHGTRL
jgi:ubiquitin fusion degradation protein 1